MNDFKPGLEGVVAVETEIAEPDREGGVASLPRRRHRASWSATCPYEKVWGLLVDDDISVSMPEPGAARAAGAERQRAGRPPVRDRPALRRLAARQAERDLRRAGARGPRAPLGADDGDRRALGREGRRADDAGSGRRALRKATPRPRSSCSAGAARPTRSAAKAIDTYWICTAEHGLNASTFTARVVASTGADCGAALSSAVGALSGPLHGGAPAYVKPMLQEVEQMGDPERWVREALEKGKRIMGFGHRVYRAEDPRSRILKRTAKELGSPQVELAEQLEQAALKALQERHPERAARDERRVLLGDRARRRGDPAAARARDVRLLARGRLVGAHPGAEAHRPALPAVRAVRRPLGTIAHVGLTLAEAAAVADELAKQGKERELADLRRDWSDEIEERHPLGRLPRARRRLPGDRAAPLPPEGRAPAPRPRGRQPGLPRLRAPLARAALARPPAGRSTPCGRSCTRCQRRRQRGRPSPGGPSACANGSPQRDTVVLLQGIAEEDGLERDLRATAAKVAAGLEKRAKAR